MRPTRRLVSLPVLLVAVAGSIAALSVWRTVALARDNQQLRSALLATLSVSAPPSAHVANANAAELDKAKADLEQARTRLREAKDQAEKLAAELTIAPAEELKSLGRSDVLAAKGVSLIQGVEEMFKDHDASNGKRPAVDAKNMSEWLVNSEAIGDLESNPAAIADVHAHALRQRLGLDEAVTRRVREQLAAEFEHLRARGLDRPSRPPSAQEEWYPIRDWMLRLAAARVEEQIPADLREPHAVVEIMNLGTGFRTRTGLGSGGELRMDLHYEVPGKEPIRF